VPPITASVEIDRPVEEVFAYATGPDRFSEWQKGVVDGRMDSAGVSQVGDHCLTTRRIGFANRSVTSELTSFDPPHKWSVRGVDGPIRASVDVTVEPLSETASRLTISVDFEGRGIGALLVPLLVRREARREMPVNVTTLKHRLESTA
jgi:uncharacterized protein YndB with AHSA1/START domain